VKIFKKLELNNYMEPIRHTLVNAFVKWRNKQLNEDLKTKAFNILEPHINELITEKTLTEEEKKQVKEKSEKVLEVIDEHFNTISSRSS
jgi:DNA-binding SARP family transcriptional activator